jgi:hypothetical protein
LDKSTDIRVEKDTVSITENDVVSPENETIWLEQGVENLIENLMSW